MLDGANERDAKRLARYFDEANFCVARHMATGSPVGWVVFWVAVVVFIAAGAARGLAQVTQRLSQALANAALNWRRRMNKQPERRRDIDLAVFHALLQDARFRVVTLVEEAAPVTALTLMSDDRSLVASDY